MSFPVSLEYSWCEPIAASFFWKCGEILRVLNSNAAGHSTLIGILHLGLDDMT